MYVVTMFRAGPKQERFETHSYTLGVFYTLDQAKFFANVEMICRGGNKYDAYCEYHVAGSVDEPHSIDESKLGWLKYEYSEEVQKEVERRYGKEVG
jgi:hypothetical protein